MSKARHLQHQMDVVNKAASTTLFTISMTDPESSSCFCQWGLVFAHGGNQQVAAGHFTWAATNDGGSTPTINWALDTQELSASTLTIDAFLITYGANVLTIAINLTTGSGLNAGATDTQQIRMSIEQTSELDITLG